MKPPETAGERVERARSARKGARLRHAEKGHSVGVTADPASGRVHAAGSILAELSSGGDLREGVREENIRYQKIAGRGRRNILFMIDASSSMLTEERLSYVKGCVVSLLEDAYVKRTRAAVIAFGGGGARLVCPFTSSAELAASKIRVMPGGGSTPLVPALGIAASLLDRMEGEAVRILLLSDGRYDRTKAGGESARIREFGALCARRKIPVTLIGSGSGNRTAVKRMLLLSGWLGAKYRPLRALGELKTGGVP